AETAGVAVASPPGDGTSLVARVGTVDHTARRHVAGEVARGDGGADARVAADADSLREVGPLAHQRQPAREMLGAGLVGNSVLAEAQLGARADPGFLVDDHAIHFRALLDLHVVHDDAVTHHRARRHLHAREQHRALDLPRDAATVRDQAARHRAPGFEAHRGT